MSNNNNNLKSAFESCITFYESQTTDSKLSNFVENLNIEEKSEKSDLDKIKELLVQISGQPIQDVYHLLRQRCRLEIEEMDYHSAALSLLQSQSIVFRQQALFQYNKRLMRSELKRLQILKQGDKKKDLKNEQEEESVDKQQREILIFRPPEEERESILYGIKTLPKDWNIIQVSVDPRFRESLRFKSTPTDQAFTKSNFGLFVISMQGGSDEINIYSVDTVHNGENPTILAEFQDVIETHRSLFKAERNPTRSGLQMMKEKVDDRMKSLIDTLENKWLGFSKCLFFGKPVSRKRLDALSSQMSILKAKYFSKDEVFQKSGNEYILERLLDTTTHMNSRQLEKGLSRCFESMPASDLFPEFLKDFKICAKFVESVEKTVKRFPTVLILDREIQRLPWESLKCFQASNGRQPFSRVPSVQFLLMLYQQHLSRNETDKVRSERIFYVLNPDKNLAKTQERLEPEFQKMSLGSGVVGQQPSLQQMTSVLSSWDAYMYCGHGANLKNVPLQEIEKLHVQATPLLFGCNSGKMERLGRHLDPLGVVSHYLIATAPRMLGFLWPITDRDVDSWTIKFLEHWIGSGPGNHESEFVRAVANLRGNFTWTINSAATVVYGLPDYR